MQDLSAVVARVEKLERENRRLKIAGGAVVAVLAVAALVGAVMPQVVPEEVVARAFRLVDEDGRLCASLGQTAFGTGLGLFDDAGRQRAVLTTTSIGSGFWLFDDHETQRVALYGGADRAGLRLDGEDGRQRVLVESGEEDRSWMSFYDSRENLRANLGVHAGFSTFGLYYADDGAGMQAGDGSVIAVFDEAGRVQLGTVSEAIDPSAKGCSICIVDRSGNVIWRAPR